MGEYEAKYLAAKVAHNMCAKSYDRSPDPVEYLKEADARIQELEESLEFNRKTLNYRIDVLQRELEINSIPAPWMKSITDSNIKPSYEPPELERRFATKNLKASCDKIADQKKRIAKLEEVIIQTLAENPHLADGENCTLIRLKNIIGESNEQVRK